MCDPLVPPWQQPHLLPSRLMSILCYSLLLLWNSWGSFLVSRGLHTCAHALEHGVTPAGHQLGISWTSWPVNCCCSLSRARVWLPWVATRTNLVGPSRWRAGAWKAMGTGGGESEVLVCPGWKRQKVSPAGGSEWSWPGCVLRQLQGQDFTPLLPLLLLG